MVMTPNSIELSTFRPLAVVFGANSSGKSTLMKQTGLLCVMAQAGLWGACIVDGILPLPTHLHAHQRARHAAHEQQHAHDRGARASLLPLTLAQPTSDALLCRYIQSITRACVVRAHGG